MGTVGLNFGSATSGAGFDVASTVTAILAAQQAIQAPIQNQISTLQAQDTVFSTLGTDLSTLTTRLQALTDATGVLAEKQGSSSDTNVLSLTSADTSAIAGSHNIVVTSLATTASTYSSAVAATDTLSGSITLNGHQISVVSHTSDTLSTFATAINQAAIGVTAGIISDANGSRLSIVSNTSGAAGSVTITNNTLTDSTTSTALTFATPVAGANAVLKVDGVDISNASNTVTGAIPGVTFQLLSSAPATTVQVLVANDNTAIESAVSDLVTAYNTVLTDIQGQEKNDSTGKAEPLFGNPTLNLLQAQLQAAVYGGAASGGINSITQLGITIGSDGKLTVDTSALDTALNSNFSNIQGFLQNSGSFGQNLATTLNGLGTTAPSGAIYLAQQENSSIETNLNAQITAQNALLATEKTTLTTELTTANQELQAIPEQLSEISQIYSAISGYNQKTY